MHFPRAHEKSGMVAHAALHFLLSNHPWRVRCGALEIVVYAQTDVGLRNVCLAVRDVRVQVGALRQVVVVAQRSLLGLGYAVRRLLTVAGADLAWADVVVGANQPCLGVRIGDLEVAVILMLVRCHQFQFRYRIERCGNRPQLGLQAIALIRGHTGELAVVVRSRHRVWIRRWYGIGWHEVVACRRRDRGVTVCFLGGDSGVELEAAEDWRVIEHGVREAVLRVARCAQRIAGVGGHRDVGLETGFRRHARPWFERGARFLEGGQATAQAHGTEVALQADAALTLEQRTGIAFQRTRIGFIANFQLENSFQAIAQIFRTLETQLVVVALGDFGGFTSHFAQASIDRAVDLDGRLRLCGCGKGAEECEGNE